MQEGQVNQTCSRKLAGILNVPLGLSTCKLESDDCIAILGLGRNFTAQSVFGKLPVLQDNNRATRHNLRPSKSTESAAGRRRLCEVEAVAFDVEPRKAEIPAMGNCIRWIGKSNLRFPFFFIRTGCRHPLSCGGNEFIPSSPKWNLRLSSFGRFLSPQI